MSTQGTETDVLGTSHSPSEPNNGAGTEQDYRLYLHRLFGKETAEYFLNPSPVHTSSPAWYILLMKNMGDEVSAEAVWDALREHSTRRLRDQEEESESLEVVKVSADHDGQRARGHLRHLAGVRYMFNLAQIHQAYSAHVLSLNHPALLLDDLEELEGPHSYLPISPINR
ncbi:uncharacterized protein si:rp71-17i16.6 [Coregonus clupeaformis]|uniref:uncharacterized protein si:rp71-17i16.6 n=1 Tax=Coregonus clupeaformis TaxID=59861 RepID=UPI001BE0F517|nr:uncharacterized protein si:rp71-17i16.6 [Coregonus clupeaformis]XP_045062807.1 uncharacterized protein si:rp71-17i16.6 [Coregonus clupeaformis]